MDNHNHKHLDALPVGQPRSSNGRNSRDEGESQQRAAAAAAPTTSTNQSNRWFEPDSLVAHSLRGRQFSSAATASSNTTIHSGGLSQSQDQDAQRSSRSLFDDEARRRAARNDGAVRASRRRSHQRLVDILNVAIDLADRHDQNQNDTHSGDAPLFLQQDDHPLDGADRNPRSSSHRARNRQDDYDTNNNQEEASQ